MCIHSVMDAIFERHSVRSFSERQVSDEDVRKIVSAGCAAPSSKNDQPWKIVVVRQPRLSRIASDFIDAADSIEEGKIRKNCVETYSIMGRASVCIFVFLDADPKAPRYFAHIQSIGAFIENMSLEACSLGIGSLWCGDILQIREEAMKILDVESPPAAALLLGYESLEARRKKHKTPEDILIRGYDEWDSDR